MILLDSAACETRIFLTGAAQGRRRMAWKRIEKLVGKNMEYLFDGISIQNGRNVNMDSLLLTERTINGISSVLAVVCDGVGSMSDGAYASSVTVKLLNEWFESIDSTERAGLKLRDTILNINTEIVRTAGIKGLQTATTLSALMFVGEKYFVVHAGDSRIYTSSDKGLVLLTVDSVTETGKLTSYIGRRDNPELFYSEGEASNGVFLLCSDGLYKRTTAAWLWQNINADNRKSIRKTLNNLSDFAIKQGELDNISIAIVKTMK